MLYITIYQKQYNKITYFHNILSQMISYKQNEQITQYSILNLKTKIQQFLLYFIYSLSQNTTIKFSYDSRTQILNIEGHIEKIVSCRYNLINLLQQYDSTSFSLGFSSATLMNVIVGVIANKPKIKYYNQKKINQFLGQYPDVIIQVEKNRTYMLGPKQQVRKLGEDIGKLLVTGAVAVGKCYMQKKQRDAQNNKMLQQSLKKIQPQKINNQKIQPKKIQDQKPHPNKIINQKTDNINKMRKELNQIAFKKQQSKNQENPSPKKHIEPNIIKQLDKNEQNHDYLQQNISQNKVQAKLVLKLTLDIVSSTKCCEYLANKYVQMLKIQVPSFIFTKWERKQLHIIIFGYVIDQKYQTIAQNIFNRQLQILMIQSFTIDPKDDVFIQKVKKVVEFRIFFADDLSKVIHISSQNRTISQIARNNNFKKFITELYDKHKKQKQIIKAQQDQLKNAEIPRIVPGISLPTMLSPKTKPPQFVLLNTQQYFPPQPPQQPQQAPKPIIIQKRFQFPNMIGQQLWRYVEDLLEEYIDINVKFNAQLIFLGQASFTRIYQDSSFIARGAQGPALNDFRYKITQQMQSLKKQTLTLSFQITNQTHKNIWQQLPQLQILQQKHRTRIITNPQIGINFKMKQIKNKMNQKHQIIGIKGSQCDLMIDKFQSILVFDRIKDYEMFTQDCSSLNNIIGGEFYAFMSIRQKNKKKNLIQCILEQTKNYINKNQKAQHLKIFIFAQPQVLQYLIWSFLQLNTSITIPQLKLYLITHQKSKQNLSNKNIPDCNKRWYVQLPRKAFYQQSCNILINKAIQNGDQEIFLYSNDIQVYDNLFSVDVGKKIMSHSKYPKIVVMYRDCKSWIQFDFQGHTHRLNQQNYQLIRQAEIAKKSPIQINICILLIKLGSLQQINIWNSYSRKLKYQQITLQNKNFFFTNQSSIYPLQIIGKTSQQIYCTKQQLLKQFYKLKQQTLKFKSVQNFKDKVKIQQLYKLCSVHHMQINKIDEKQVTVCYQLGNSGIQIIRKYVEMIMNVVYAIQYPQFWENDGKEYSQIQINDLKCQEYVNVKKIFPYKILKLKRIQNLNSYARYYNEKKFLQKLNNNKKVQEKYLFHGTRTMDPKLIIADKQITFNVNYSSDKNYMGRATYFAVKPQYSHNYRFKISKNVGSMLLCLVLVGQSQKCPKLHVDYRDTDFKDKQKTVRYQSMTDIYDGSQIYTVYKNNRAYPMYLLQYEA